MISNLIPWRFFCILFHGLSLAVWINIKVWNYNIKDPLAWKWRLCYIYVYRLLEIIVVHFVSGVWYISHGQYKILLSNTLLTLKIWCYFQFHVTKRSKIKNYAKTKTTTISREDHKYLFAKETCFCMKK